MAHPRIGSRDFVFSVYIKRDYTFFFYIRTLRPVSTSIKLRVGIVSSSFLVHGATELLPLSSTAVAK